MHKGEFKDMTLPREKLLGIYRGVVEDNVDDLKAGRCKVRVFGVHSSNKTKTPTDGIPTDELPWAQPVLGLIEGSISGYGFFGVPLQGSHVFVFFEAGNILEPRYFASAPAIPTQLPDTTKGFNDPDGVYPETANLFTSLYNPDWNTGSSTAEYPHNIVLATHGKHLIEIDSTPGAMRYKIKHPSGTVVDVDNSGNVTVSEVGYEIKTITLDKTLIVNGSDTESITVDKTKNIKGNENIVISGNRTETIAGNKLETTTGNDMEDISGTLTITVSGNVTIQSTGGDVLVQANGNATVRGSTVNVTASGLCQVTGAPLQLN